MIGWRPSPGYGGADNRKSPRRAAGLLCRWFSVNVKHIAPGFSKTESMLNTLIKAEVAEREVRSINYQMKVARFPAYRDLAGFDFNESSVDETLLKSPHRCDFIADAHNIVMIGGPGTGKTQVSIASRG